MATFDKFDPDTHTATDASAARAALNAAVLQAQAAYAAVFFAEREARRLAHVAAGAPEQIEINRIAAALNRARDAWPMPLVGLRTDLQRDRDDAASEASMAVLRRHAGRGELSTVGD